MLSRLSETKIFKSFCQSPSTTGSTLIAARLTFDTTFLRLPRSLRRFSSAFDSPQVVARSVIRQAADYQIIDLRRDGAYWFDSNGLIVSVPVGQTAMDVMTRFCLTEKGPRFSLLLRSDLTSWRKDTCHARRGPASAGLFRIFASK